MTELKPCPFCGNEASDDYYVAYSTDSSFSYIGCVECGVMVNYNESRGDREFAVKTWNQRHSEDVRERIISDILEVFEEPCRTDHHGYCQEHFLQPEDECVIGVARRFMEGK